MRLLLGSVSLPASLHLTFKRPDGSTLHEATTFSDQSIGRAGGAVVAALDDKSGVFYLHTPYEDGKLGRTWALVQGCAAILPQDCEQAEWCRGELEKKAHYKAAEVAKVKADAANEAAEKAMVIADIASKEAARAETIRRQGLCNQPVNGGECVRPRAHAGDCRPGQTAKKAAA